MNTCQHIAENLDLQFWEGMRTLTRLVALLLLATASHSFGDATLRAPQSAIGNPYLFQGARYDAETGFYYLRNRYYDPRTGRFLQRDPIWDEQNVGGWYTFVGNGPVSRWDALGLDDSEESEDADDERALKAELQQAANELAQAQPFVVQRPQEYAEKLAKLRRAFAKLREREMVREVEAERCENLAKQKLDEFLAERTRVESHVRTGAGASKASKPAAAPKPAFQAPSSIARLLAAYKEYSRQQLVPLTDKATGDVRMDLSEEEQTRYRVISRLLEDVKAVEAYLLWRGFGGSGCLEPAEASRVAKGLTELGRFLEGDTERIQGLKKAHKINPTAVRTLKRFTEKERESILKTK